MKSWADHALLAVVAIGVLAVMGLAVWTADPGTRQAAAEGGLLMAVLTGGFMVLQRVIEAVKDKWTGRQFDRAVDLMHASRPEPAATGFDSAKRADVPDGGA